MGVDYLVFLALKEPEGTIPVLRFDKTLKRLEIGVVQRE